MSRPDSRTVLRGAVMGGLLGALLGALMASRSGDGRERRRPSATEATAIGMTALGLVKQVLDAIT